MPFNPAGYDLQPQQVIAIREIVQNGGGLTDAQIDAGAMPIGVTPFGALIDKNGSPVSGGGAARRVLWFNRLLEEKPQPLAPSGLGNYGQRGDYRINVTMTEGSNVVTYTGGHPIADAGTAGWMGVLQVGDSYQTVNVLSTAGNNITLAQTMAVSGAAVLGSYHENIGGLHLSPMGGMALADMLVAASPYALQSDQCVYDADSVRGTWYTTPWVAPNSTPDYWRQYGGLANNALVYRDNYNMFSGGTAKLVRQERSYHASVAATAAGQGVVCDIPMRGAGGVLDLRVGCGANTSELVTDQATVTVLADGVQIYSRAAGPVIYRHIVPFGACSTLTVRVTATNGATTIRLGRMIVSLPAENLQRVIERGDVVLPIGDSWLDERGNGGVVRGEVVTRLRTLAAARGAQVLTSVAVGGTTATDALTVVGGVRRIDSWIAANPSATKALIHYYLNDQTFGHSAAQWSSEIMEICRTLIAAGITPVVVLPGCTAADAGTQSLQTAYGQVLGMPAPMRDTIERALQAEISAVGSFVNVVGKRPGRMLACSTNSATYVARGSAAADVWDCITAGATPATITPA